MKNPLITIFSVFLLLFSIELTAQLKVNSLGKVGIGFPSPSELLHLYSASDQCFMKADAKGINKYAGLKLTGWHYSNYATSQIYMDYYGATGHHGLNYISGRSGFASHWFKNNNGDVIMSVVDKSGYDGVAILKDLPSYALDVNGTIRGDNVSPSDLRLKDNIIDLSNSLSIIQQLRSVSYNRKDLMTTNNSSILSLDSDTITNGNLLNNPEIDRKHYGFIA
ncbi:MAG: tail fiber domain-containing protein [Cyclobacteriaceae bacterium]